MDQDKKEGCFVSYSFRKLKPHRMEFFEHKCKGGRVHY